MTVLAEGVDLRAIPRAIYEAGYQPGPLQLRARGTVRAGAFLIPGWPPLPLQGALPEGETELRADVDLEHDPPALEP